MTAQTARSRRLTRTVTALLCLAGAAGVGAAVATAAPAQDAPADFTGHWSVNSGAGFTVAGEDGSGACTGSSDLQNSGYGFQNCQVTGSNYAFDVTYGSGYLSHNTGTFDAAANTLSGSFNDGRGDNGYTGSRDQAGPGVTGSTPTPMPSDTSTSPTPTAPAPTASPSPGGLAATTIQLICDTPANAGQQGSCTATVGGAGGTPTHPYPTGGVTMVASSGTLLGSTCTLAAATGAGLAPSCTLGYLPPAGGLAAGTPVPVSARYAGDSVFAAGSGGTQLYGFTPGPDSDDDLGICQDGSGDCDGFDESVAEAVADDTGVIDLVASCPAALEESPRLALATPRPDPYAAARLASCILTARSRTQAAASQPSLESVSQAKSILNNLVLTAQTSVSEHTGGKTADNDPRRDSRLIFMALKSLRDGDPGAAADDAERVIKRAGGFGNKQADPDPLAGEPAAGAITTSGALSRPLDVRAALLAVLSKQPSAAQRHAFDTAVTQAAAKKPSTTRTLARLTLATARALGSIELRTELSRHGKLPASVTLGSMRTTIPAGQTAHVHLVLTRQGQRLLRVLRVSPTRHPLTVRLDLTQTRASAKRSAQVTLRVV